MSYRFRAIKRILFESHAPHSFGRFNPLAAGCQAKTVLQSRQRHACAFGPRTIGFLTRFFTAPLYARVTA
jgi:hypothetical protein